MTGRKPAKPMTDAEKVAANAKAKQTARARFLKVGASRVTKALKAIDNLGPVSNRKSYDYDESEWIKARNALVNAVNNVDAAFKAALTGKQTSKNETFKFEG